MTSCSNYIMTQVNKTTFQGRITPGHSMYMYVYIYIYIVRNIRSQQYIQIKLIIQNAKQIYHCYIILRPELIIPKLCTLMSGECTNTTICCNNNECSHPYGLAGATGCKIVPGTNGIGCCAKHYCELIDEKKKKTQCRQIIY